MEILEAHSIILEEQFRMLREIICIWEHLALVQKNVTKNCGKFSLLTSGWTHMNSPHSFKKTNKQTNKKQ